MLLHTWTLLGGKHKDDKFAATQAFLLFATTQFCSSSRFSFYNFCNNFTIMLNVEKVFFAHPCMSWWLFHHTSLELVWWLPLAYCSCFCHAHRHHHRSRHVLLLPRVQRQQRDFPLGVSFRVLNIFLESCGNWSWSWFRVVLKSKAPFFYPTQYGARITSRSHMKYW